MIAYSSRCQSVRPNGRAVWFEHGVFNVLGYSGVHERPGRSLDARDRYRHQAHEGARRNVATFSEQLLGLHAFNPDDTGRSCLDRSRRRLQALSVAVRPVPTDRDSSDRTYSFAYSSYPPERFANTRADASSCNSITAGHSNGSADTICERCSRDRPADTKPHGNPSRPQLSQGGGAGSRKSGQKNNPVWRGPGRLSGYGDFPQTDFGGSYDIHVL